MNDKSCIDPLDMLAWMSGAFAMVDGARVSRGSHGASTMSAGKIPMIRRTPQRSSAQRSHSHPYREVP